MSTQARSIDVANAAVAFLNSAPVQTGFVQGFTAVRAYQPLYDLKEHKAGLKVTVIPATLDETPLTRAVVQSLLAIDVGVQNFVANDAASDVLMLLVQQIKQALERGLTLAEPATDCGWQGTQNEPIFFPDHMQQHSVFTSVPRFTFLTRRAR
jgi:hypothetical protein